MQPSSSLPSARTAWTTGHVGCCQRDTVAQSLEEKHVSDTDVLQRVGICLLSGHTGKLKAPLLSEPKKEAPGLHNELMQRFPQLSRGCRDRTGGSYSLY